MADVIGYHAASELLTGDMRRAGCEYLSRCGRMVAPWDIGHEALVLSLAQLPLAYLSPAGRAALQPEGAK